MEERQDQGSSRWLEMGVKLALSFVALFPVYIVLYLAFPLSIVAIYLISAVLLALFAPWDEWKKKFLS